jgi:hypothetical protein
MTADRIDPEGLSCAYAGHSWRDAGGGLEICALCEAEQWVEEADESTVAETCLSDRSLFPGDYRV